MYTNEFNAHQGDVQIFSIDKIELTKKVEKTFFAKSEKSGHVHALCGDYELFIDENNPDIFEIDVKEEGAILNHTLMSNLTKEFWGTCNALPVADHKATIIPKGKYRVGIQRRKKPFSKIWEKVVD